MHVDSCGCNLFCKLTDMCCYAGSKLGVKGRLSHICVYSADVHTPQTLPLYVCCVSCGTHNFMHCLDKCGCCCNLSRLSQLSRRLQASFFLLTRDINLCCCCCSSPRTCHGGQQMYLAERSCSSKLASKCQLPSLWSLSP